MNITLKINTGNVKVVGKCQFDKKVDKPRASDLPEEI